MDFRSDPVRQPGQVALEVSRSVQSRARGHRTEGTESSAHEEEQEEQQKEATVQLKADPQRADRSDRAASPLEVQRQLGVGTALPTHVAGRFSSAYNHDFSDVRLHTESAVAHRMGAKALAVGRSIAFAPGQFQPGSRDSDLLIAHELAHIVQQSGGLGGGFGALQGAGPANFEVEADHAAEVAVGGGVVDSFSSVQTAVQCGGEDDPPSATFTVETEVYAQPGEPGRWIRGKVTEVREPLTTSEDGVLQVTGPPPPPGTTDDGWEYIVTFEADSGYTEVALLSYNIHDAKVQQNPTGAGGRVGTEEEDPQFTDIGTGSTTDEQPASSEQEAGEKKEEEVVSEEVKEEESLPPEVPPAPQFTPLPHPPSVSSPSPLNLDVPTLSLDSTPAEEAWYKQQTGQDMQTEIDAVNASVDQLFSQSEEQLCSVVDQSQQDIHQASTDSTQLQSRLEKTSTQMSSTLETTEVCSTEDAQTVATEGENLVTQNTEATQSFLNDLTLQQQQLLEANATSLETEVTRRQGAYATQIDGFITTEAEKLKKRLKDTIKILEDEAAKEEEQVYTESQNYSGDYTTAMTRAEELAKIVAKARVKKKYAQAMHRVADAAVDELLAQRGNPSRLIAGSLHAPTIAQLWPATQHYVEEAKKQQKTSETQAAEAKKQYGAISTRATTEQKAAVQQNEQLSQQTLSSAEETAAENLQCSAEETERQINTATTEVRDQRQQDLQGVQQLLGQASREGTVPPRNLWQGYMDQYQRQLVQDDLKLSISMDDYRKQRSEQAKEAATQTTTNAQTAVQDLQVCAETDAATFTSNVQGGIDQTTSALTNMQDVTTQTAEQSFAAAQKRGEDELALLQSDGAAFFEKRIKERVSSYGKDADTQMGDLSEKMAKAMESAEKEAETEERANRETRERDCWGGIDYTWGTDEERLMKGVAGLTKVQGYALQGYYSTQHSNTLREDIIDDTSGALKRSLLAWIVGDQKTAVKEALDYAAYDSALGLTADTATAEIALRGMSEQTRRDLAGDPEFERLKNRLLVSIQTDVFSGTADYDAIAVLADTSMTKEAAEQMGDAIRVEDTMDHIGTNESGAYEILGKRDAAGNKKLSADYAKYYYNRYLKGQNNGQRWEDLPAEDRQYYEQNLLTNRISGGNLGLRNGPGYYDDGEFSGREEDRALALLSGNKGAAAAAQLEDAAWGSNNVEEAQSAMTSLNEGRSSFNATTGEGDWLAGAAYAERRAEFMDTATHYQNDDLSNVQLRQRITSHDSRERRTEVAGQWEANTKTTRTYIATEYGSDGIAQDTNTARNQEGAYNNTDENVERILLDSFDTGQADARDLMAYGVDTAGTREKFVTKALEGIANEGDINLRLSRLNQLGAYCWTFFEREIPPYERDRPGTRQGYLDTADRRMGNLPAYINSLEGDFSSLRQNIKGIMVVLDWETDGGEQFDMELFVVQATARTDNVTDALALAKARIRSQLSEGDLEDWDNETVALNFVKITPQERNELLTRQATMTDEQVAADSVNHRLSTDDQLRAHFKIVNNLYDAGKDVWFETATGWLTMKPGEQKPDDRVEKAWKLFQDACERVDIARQDKKSHDEQLIAAITMVVGIIAAIAIAVVSLGSATAASAGLLAAVITLTAGGIVFGAKLAILGDRYGAEDMLTDVGKTLAEAALNVLTLGLGSFKGLAKILEEVGSASLFIKFLAKAGEALPGELLGVLTNEELWDAGSFDVMATQLLLGLFTNASVGTFLDKVPALKAIRDSQDALPRQLGQLLDNVLPLLADPRQWESPDFGWQLLQATAQSLIGTQLANSVRSHMLNGVNRKLSNGQSTMTTADWTHIQNMPEEHRAWFLANLHPAHAQTLQTANPALHAQLFGAPPPAAPPPVADVQSGNDNVNGSSGATTDPNATPVVTPVVTPDVTHVVTPDTTPVVTPDTTPVITPDHTPVVTPDVTPVVTPDHTPVVSPDVTPVVTPDHTPVVTTDTTSVVTPDTTPVVTPDTTPVVTVHPTPDDHPVVTLPPTDDHPVVTLPAPDDHPVVTVHPTPDDTPVITVPPTDDHPIVTVHPTDGTPELHPDPTPEIIPDVVPDTIPEDSSDLHRDPTRIPPRDVVPHTDPAPLLTPDPKVQALNTLDDTTLRQRLMDIHGIGPAKADAILAERARGGPFRDMDDLAARVKGIGDVLSGRIGSDLDHSPVVAPPRFVDPVSGMEFASEAELLALQRVQSTAKGTRPAPTTYLSPEQINTHLAHFDGGGAYLVPKSSLDSRGRLLLGRPDGQFVMTKAELDGLLARANGDISVIERELGIPAGAWAGKELVRIDIPDPRSLNLRMPSGNEAGANELWLPGGKLPTGQLEAVVDQIPTGKFTETPVPLTVVTDSHVRTDAPHVDAPHVDAPHVDAPHVDAPPPRFVDPVSGMEFASEAELLALQRVQSTAKGTRPDPTTYLSPEQISTHLAHFEGGGGFLVPKDVLDRFGRLTLGRADGQFVMTKAELDGLLARANGDISVIERELGIPAGAWAGRELVRIDIPDPRSLNLRMPSGNEAGANELWLPGGKLPTGQLEAVVDQIPAGKFTETPVVASVLPDSHIDPTHTDPTRVDPTHTDPTHIDPTHTDPTHVDPTHTDPTHIDPTDTGHHDDPPSRTDAGWWDRFKGFMGFGPPAAPAAPPTLGELHGILGDVDADLMRPGTGSEARIVKEGINLVVEVPVGHSTEQVRQDLQRQLAAEQQRIHTDAAAELGDNLVIVRSSGSDVSYQRRQDGTVEVRVPYGHDLSLVGSRLKERRQKAATHLSGTVQHSDIQSGRNVVVGHPIHDEAAGHDILRRLTQGDLSALEQVGVHGLADGFDTDVGRRSVHEIEWGEIEWGLGRLPDGSLIIIRGEHGAVDWGPYPDVVALAHSHPTLGPDGSSKALNLKGGDSIDAVLNDIENNGALLPSSGDLGFVHSRGILDHVVHTPYRFDPATGKVQAGFDSKLPTIDVHIVSTTKGEDGRIRAVVEIRAGGQVLWSGNVESMAGFSVKAGLFDRTAMPTPEDMAILSHHAESGIDRVDAGSLPLATVKDIPAAEFVDRMRKVYPAATAGMSDAEIREFRQNLLAYMKEVPGGGLNLGGMLERYQNGQRFNPATKTWPTQAEANLLLDVAPSRFQDRLENLTDRAKGMTKAQRDEFRAELEKYRKLNPNGKMSADRLVEEFLDGSRIGATGAHYNPAGGETTSQMRERLIRDFPGGNWTGVEAAAQAKFGSSLKAVVPVEGIYRLKNGGKDLTYGDVMNKAQTDQLRSLLTTAYQSLGHSAKDAKKLANDAVTNLKSESLVVVQGTPTVRAAMNYDSNYKNNNTIPGTIKKPEVHHLAPLYLGGSHTLDNLIALEGLSGNIHDQVHALFDSLTHNGGSLNPNALFSAYKSELEPGYAIVTSDGTVHLRKHNEPP